jgi:small subunit ribosomal protein S16
MGRKRRPFYRVVAADSRCPRDGRHIEVLGHFNPMADTLTLELKMDRINYWLGVGAQPSDTAASLIKRYNAKSAEGAS